MRKSKDLPRLIINIQPTSTQDQLDEFIPNDKDHATFAALLYADSIAKTWKTKKYKAGPQY